MRRSCLVKTGIITHCHAMAVTQKSRRGLGGALELQISDTSFTNVPLMNDLRGCFLNSLENKKSQGESLWRNLSLS